MTRGMVMLVLFALAVVGCGESDGEGGGKGGGGTGGSGGTAGTSGTSATGGSAGGSVAPVPLDEFVNAYVAAICENGIDACCDRGGFVFDLAACRATMQDYASAIAAGAMADPPTSSYDSSVAGACLAFAASLGERCVIGELPDPNPCDHMFTGRLAQNAPCTANTECAPAVGYTVQCASTNGAAPVCTPLPIRDHERTAGGEPCANTCVETEYTLVCDDTTSPSAPDAACYTSDGLYCSSSAVCTVLPAIGEPCGSLEYCEEGAFCEGDVCTAERAAGACDTSDACVSTSYCDLDTGQCLAKGADGAPCPSADQNAEECLSGGCNRGMCGPPLIASEVNCFSD